MTVALRGFDGLAKELDALANDKALSAGQVAVTKAARHFGRVIKPKIPRSTKTQRSRRNKDGSQVISDYGHWQDQVRVKGTRKFRGRGFARAQVNFGDAFWSAFYEFGTARQPARPLIRPAFDAEEETMIVIIGESLAKGIEKRGGAAISFGDDFGIGA